MLQGRRLDWLLVLVLFNKQSRHEHQDTKYVSPVTAMLGVMDTELSLTEVLP